MRSKDSAVSICKVLLYKIVQEHLGDSQVFMMHTQKERQTTYFCHCRGEMVFLYIVLLRIRVQEHASLDAEQKRERLLKIYFDS